MTETRARQFLSLALPTAALALVLIPYLAVRSDLPDRLATHFDGSGTPDGSMTPAGFLFFTLAMVGAGLAVCIWLARTRRLLPQAVAPFVGFLAGFFVGLGSGIALVTFLTQRGLEVWTEAGDVWALIVVPLVLAGIVGALSAQAASALPAQPRTFVDGDRPTMELDPQQHAVWTETLHSNWLARMGAAAIVIGVVVAIGTFWWLVFPALVTGIVTLSLATLQVRADRTGLHVKYGFLSWPRTHVGIERIAGAEVIDVRPMEWGGWGYRGSLKLMKQAAVVHRAGPGIRVDLRDGRVFVVTVDSPETPVALLNAEVARLAPA